MRLGGAEMNAMCGESSASAVQDHPFFGGIEWAAVAAKQVQPFWLPAKGGSHGATTAVGGRDVEMDSEAEKLRWETYEELSSQFPPTAGTEWPCPAHLVEAGRTPVAPGGGDGKGPGINYSPSTVFAYKPGEEIYPAPDGGGAVAPAKIRPASEQSVWERSAWERSTRAQ